jgi:hypothetical protein
MDDFLYNLRKSVEERGKSGNRHTDGNTNRGGDRRCGIDRRNRRPQKNHNDRRSYPPYNRNLHEIRVLLEKLLENQGQQQAIDKKRLALEERRTTALERIAHSLNGNSGTLTDTQTRSMAIEAVDAVSQKGDAASQKGDAASQTVVNKASKTDTPATAGELMTTLRAQGKSYEKIANALEAAGFPTVSGRGRWRGQTVKRELAKLGVLG